MTIKELKAYLKAELPELEDMGDGKLSTYLGSVESLESIAPKAELQSAARLLNAWVERDEGDVYLCMNGGRDR